MFEIEKSRHYIGTDEATTDIHHSEVGCHVDKKWLV